jgi:hypothetical protein
MKRLSGGSVLAVCLVATFLALGGCGKSSNVTGLGANSQLTADDVAVQVGASASADGGGMMTEIEGTSSAVPMAARPVTFYGVTAADTTFARGPFTVTLGRTFYDIDDVVLQQWDPSAVRAVIDSWVRGAITGLRYQATVGRTGVLNVNGLAAAVDTLLFDGTATDTTDAVFTSLDGLRTVDVHVLATRVLTSVRALKNRTVNPWPLSGTATWTVSVDKFANGPRGGIEAHYQAVVEMTFDGTQFAGVSVSGRYPYRIDLQTGAAVRS